MRQFQKVETHIAGIPCLARVDYFFKKEPDFDTWASDWDYYGYTEIEFTVCDRRGRPAPWLEKKMTDAEKERIENEILEAA